MNLATQLSDFVINAHPNSGSTDAEAIMRLSLYDWMVCGMAGAVEPVARIVRGVPCPDVMGVPVFGADMTYFRADAALINGATSHALDYDDTHFGHIGHPSVAVLPAAFAMEADGAETLWAALIGAEVSVRVGLWLGRAHYEIGFHQTATAGAFGATAAAGLLWGLNQDQMQTAFGIAATQAAGLKAQFGTMGKPYHAGLAARTGVEAVQLAFAGFEARGQALDGVQGFSSTHAGENNTHAFNGMGVDWRMEAISHKFHACCHGLHAMLEALSDAEAVADDVVEVTVYTHPRWLDVCNIADPSSGLECKFSYRHVAAMALHGVSTAALDSYTDGHAHDLRLCDLRKRVCVQADKSLADTAVRVDILRSDGDMKTYRHDLATPLPHDNLAKKLRAKGRSLLGPKPEARLWQATHSERAPNMDALANLMKASA